MKQTVLLVEDDLHIAQVLTTLLETNGYTVICATTGISALSLSASHVPSITLLDLGLPDMDGFEVLLKMREWSAAPIIVVSVRSREKDKIEALDNGANDYITKPFSSQELLARIRANLRFYYPSSGGDTELYCFGEMTVDCTKGRVVLNGRDIKLTKTEYKLIELLARNNGRVMTYDAIIGSIWGPYAATDDNLILRVNIANIRRKIEQNHATPKYLLTEIGIGYRMADAE